MTTAHSSTGSTRPGSRVERRKAQTRQKFTAARAMLASDTAAQASIREITEAPSPALLATLQMALTEPALVDDAAIDHLAEQVLRILGTPTTRHALAHAPLPVAELPEPVDHKS